MDDLIGIIFFILFVVVPFINGLFGKGKKGAQQPPLTKPNQAPSSKTPQELEFEKRLAEARKRVQEAMAQAKAQGKQPAQPVGSTLVTTSSTASSSTASSSMMGSSQAASTSQEIISAQDFQSAEEVKVAADSLESDASEGSESYVPKLLGKSPVLKPKVARAKIFKVDSRSLANGIIWKQILDKPRSRQ